MINAIINGALDGSLRSLDDMPLIVSQIENSEATNFLFTLPSQIENSQMTNSFPALPKNSSNRSHFWENRYTAFISSILWKPFEFVSILVKKVFSSVSNVFGFTKINPFIQKQ